MKHLNKIAGAVFALMMCFSLSGCNGQRSEKVDFLVCSGDSKVGELNGYEFKLADDGKTIEELVYKMGHNKEFIETYYPDDDLDTMYDTLATNMQEYYLYMTENNTNVSWITSYIENTPETHSSQVVFSFDFTDENFDPTDEATREYLELLNIYTNFYNEDEMKFEVTEEQMESMNVSDDYQLACEIQTFDKADEHE